MTDQLRIEKVSKSYQVRGSQTTLEAIKQIDLGVERGSFLTIIGPSGCGKSTLLSIMGGLTSASTGTVYLDDEKIDRPRPDKIGMVFQEPGLYPWRTTQKNVEFGLEIKGVPRDERVAKAEKYLQLVGLSGFENYYPTQLSGGMQQRVGIARALALETEVLLMDEPFGALDEQTRLVVGAELTRIWEATKKTIVFVTHSLVEAAYLSDKIAVMSGRPSSILDVINVDAPRPRDHEDETLVEIRRRIWSYISSEAKNQETGRPLDSAKLPRPN